MTPLESIQATAYRVLRNAYLRGAAHAGGIDLLRATEEERAGLLEPFDKELAHAADVLSECLTEAQRLGMQTQIQAFHRTAVEVYDGHDMLDEAMVYANEPEETT